MKTVPFVYSGHFSGFRIGCWNFYMRVLWMQRREGRPPSGQNTQVLKYRLKSIFCATNSFERLFVNSSVGRTLTYAFSHASSWRCLKLCCTTWPNVRLSTRNPLFNSLILLNSVYLASWLKFMKFPRERRRTEILLFASAVRMFGLSLRYCSFAGRRHLKNKARTHWQFLHSVKHKF